MVTMGGFKECVPAPGLEVLNAVLAWLINDSVLLSMGISGVSLPADGAVAANLTEVVVAVVLDGSITIVGLVMVFVFCSLVFIRLLIAK